MADGAMAAAGGQSLTTMAKLLHLLESGSAVGIDPLDALPPGDYPLSEADIQSYLPPRLLRAVLPENSACICGSTATWLRESCLRVSFPFLQYGRPVVAKYISTPDWTPGDLDIAITYSAWPLVVSEIVGAMQDESAVCSLLVSPANCAAKLIVDDFTLDLIRAPPKTTLSGFLQTFCSTITKGGYTLPACEPLNYEYWQKDPVGFYFGAKANELPGVLIEKWLRRGYTNMRIGQDKAYVPERVHYSSLSLWPPSIAINITCSKAELMAQLESPPWWRPRSGSEIRSFLCESIERTRHHEMLTHHLLQVVRSEQLEAAERKFMQCEWDAVVLPPKKAIQSVADIIDFEEEDEPAPKRLKADEEDA